MGSLGSEVAEPQLDSLADVAELLRTSGSRGRRDGRPAG